MSRVALSGGALLVLLLALGLLSEGAVRLLQTIRHGSAFKVESLYHHDPATGLRLPNAGFRSERININALGFRGPEIPARKPVGTIRIAFVGASTTFSTEVSGDRATWPDRVVEKLRAHYPDKRFDYINAGVPGYTLESSLINLKMRIAPLSPDVIVVYHATNDLAAIASGMAKTAGVFTPRGDKALSWMSKYSMLWYLVEKNLAIYRRQALTEAATQRLDVAPRAIAQPFDARLREVVAAARDITPHVALATFSTRLRAEQSPEARKEAAVTALYYMPFLTPERIIGYFAAYNDVIRAVAADEAALLIGGEHDIPGDGLHFVDSVHFSDRGSKAMAERVFDGLIRGGMLQRSF